MKYLSQESWMLGCKAVFSLDIFVQLHVQMEIFQNNNSSTLLFYGIQSLPAFFQKIFPAQQIRSRVTLSVFCADVKWFH